MSDDLNVENLEVDEEETEEVSSEQDDEEKDTETQEVDEETEAEDQMTPRERGMQAQIDMLTSTVTNLTGQSGELDTEGEDEMSSVLDDLEDFITDDAAFDKATGSREGLNEVLEQVLEKAVLIIAEHTNKSLPGTIDTIVKRQVAENLMANEFFRANQDLMPQRKFAAFVFNEMVAANPGTDTQEILDKHLGPEVRKRLGMGKGKGRSRQSKAPNLKAGGSRQTPSKPNKLASEIKELEGI